MANKIKTVVLRLPGVRLSFPSLDKPRAYEEGQTEKYQATFLLDPKKPSHKKALQEIAADIKRAKQEAFPGKEPPMKPLAEVFGDGNTQVDKNGEIYDGYVGMWYLKAKATKIPRLMNADRDVVDAATAGRIMYAGCFVNATVDIWIQDHVKWGKAVRFNLRGVQFLSDGEQFGGGGASEEEFEEGFDDEPYHDASDFG